MQSINHYCNPSTNHFRQTLQDFQSLNLSKKIVAVAAAVFGALTTPFLLCLGGIALFQLAVKWLKTGSGAMGNVQNPLFAAHPNTASRAQRIGELRSMMRLDSSEHLDHAVEQGYTVLSRDNIDGFTGKGFYVQPNRIIQGEFVNGQGKGKGIIFYAANNRRAHGIYEGDIAEKPKGRAIEVTEHTWYEGGFDRLHHGKATLRNDRHQATYSGNFSNGMIDGETSIRWDTGDLFSGNGQLTLLINDYTFEGDGILTSASGIKFEGRIENMRISGDGFSFSGNGTLTHPDGRNETGQITNWVKVD